MKKIMAGLKLSVSPQSRTFAAQLWLCLESHLTQKEKSPTYQQDMFTIDLPLLLVYPFGGGPR